MLEFVPFPSHSARPRRLPRSSATDRHSDRPLRARVKRDCADLYPGVDPVRWYNVIMDGEYKDDLEGFWIQVEDWVTYVLAKHFDVQRQPELH